MQGAALAAVVAIPLSSSDGWQVLSYRRTPPNQVTFTTEGVDISVDRSAGPLVYPLPAPVRVARVEAEGRLVQGRLGLPGGARQGQKGADDFVMRVGIVETGSRRLTFWHRLVAADWLKKLFALAPPEAGLSRVRFFNVAVDPSTVGDARQHPLSDLLFEEIVAVPGVDGGFRLSVPLEPAPEVAAVWLSADGDDTGSRFVVRLTSLTLISP